ncbi:Hypothetical predicted protein [Podarcis lilfordi]|uniref:Uncharacterized protein n=1 Tax=Podarcis lilfordi TaxID=74358 RepID=A0AA35PI39_9SAUR|nr:Hypothetical predicted protein [Podarcis lilfordi]
MAHCISAFFPGCRRGRAGDSADCGGTLPSQPIRTRLFAITKLLTPESSGSCRLLLLIFFGYFSGLPKRPPQIPSKKPPGSAADPGRGSPWSFAKVFQDVRGSFGCVEAAICKRETIHNLFSSRRCEEAAVCLPFENSDIFKVELESPTLIINTCGTKYNTKREREEREKKERKKMYCL